MIRFFIYFLILFSNQFTCQSIDTIDQKKFTKRSTILSCIVPGLGQFQNNQIRPENVKNRLWWKLPIIYAGIGSTTFSVNFNNQEFRKIKEERVSRNQGNAAHNYPLYSIDQLKIIQEDYRRLRDLSLISFIGVYVLQIIDANVEAHLFLFDISDHLGFKLKPTFLMENETNYFTTQISFNIKF